MSADVAIELEEGLHARVKQLASRRGQAVDAFVHDALADVVRREEQRASFHADASCAWREYAATGLHATFEEVEAWLARLEAGEDVPPPECHG